jgi:hypothetical protein
LILEDQQKNQLAE